MTYTIVYQRHSDFTQQSEDVYVDTTSKYIDDSYDMIFDALSMFYNEHDFNDKIVKILT